MENKDKREQYKELRKQVMAIELEMQELMKDIVEIEKTTKCCGADFHKESDICSKCGEHSE